MAHNKVVAYGCLSALIALYVAGAVSVPPGSLRHEVQTLPLWFPIVAGFQNRPIAKWAALPCLAVWLALMIAIWLFLLGWARFVTGHFPPIEIAMTIVVGVGAAAGIVAAVRWKTTTRVLHSAAVAVVFLALQLLALRLSFLPYIARR